MNYGKSVSLLLLIAAFSFGCAVDEGRSAGKGDVRAVDGALELGATARVELEADDTGLTTRRSIEVPQGVGYLDAVVNTRDLLRIRLLDADGVTQPFKELSQQYRQAKALWALPGAGTYTIEVTADANASDTAAEILVSCDATLGEEGRLIGGGCTKPVACPSAITTRADQCFTDLEGDANACLAREGTDGIRDCQFLVHNMIYGNAISTIDPDCADHDLPTCDADGGDFEWASGAVRDACDYYVEGLWSDLF